MNGGFIECAHRGAVIKTIFLQIEGNVTCSHAMIAVNSTQTIILYRCTCMGSMVVSHWPIGYCIYSYQKYIASESKIVIIRRMQQTLQV